MIIFSFKFVILQFTSSSFNIKYDKLEKNESIKQIA